MSVPQFLQQEYAGALAEHLARPSETSLYCAFEIGRRLMAEGIGVVEQVMLHHEMVRRLALENPPSGDQDRLDHAADFLAESLAPTEMSLRGHREANDRLAITNRTLRQLYELAGGLNRCRSEADVVTFSINCIRSIPGVHDVRIDLYPIEGVKGDSPNSRPSLQPQTNSVLVGVALRFTSGTTAGASIEVPLVIGELTAGMLQVSGTVSTDEHKGLVSVAHQISNALERCRLYQSLERKVEERTHELVRAAKVKDDFLATVSHELRTPLTSINAVLVLLDAEKLGPLPAAIGKPLSLALSNCRRLMRTVNDLLDQTGITNGTLDLDLRPIELTAVLMQSFESGRIACGCRDLRFEVTEPARRVRVVADAQRLRQVVDNLLTNALKFSAAEQPIVIAADCHENLVRVSVADHGPGIPTALQVDIFKPFKQIDSTSTRREGGLGLGLTIAKAIIEAHGGTLGLASIEGEGTTVHFDLPVIPGAVIA